MRLGKQSELRREVRSKSRLGLRREVVQAGGRTLWEGTPPPLARLFHNLLWRIVDPYHEG
jgi:hypothetical protein